MDFENNRKLLERIKYLIDGDIPVKLGVNKFNELVRLVYEIAQSKNIPPENIFKEAGVSGLVEEGKGDLFHRVKKAIMEIRYPSIKKDLDPHIMPVKIGGSSEECVSWGYSLSPRKVFVEESVKDKEWTGDLLRNFPSSEIVYINKIEEGIKCLSENDKVNTYSRRLDNLFIVKSHSAFVKICPCTKDCVRCGYWILNIGFGCPIDCSYCYLQTYSNAPGMILPANIEDYYGSIKEFDSKVNGKIRIGTGEFTDSLAFDKYTRYSTYLIPFFKDVKNLVLELKTKVSDIDNVINTEPNGNVVISWSINPRNIAEKYERGSASMDDRIRAAKDAVKSGYKIGFHFDPIVYYDGWEDDYEGIARELFSNAEIASSTLWISLGTLRYTPGLKQISESRFSDSNIFYKGDFFRDADGKMRYARDIRIDIYKKMVKWLREYNDSYWIYLCMEDDDIWKASGLTQRTYAG